MTLYDYGILLQSFTLEVLGIGIMTVAGAMFWSIVIRGKGAPPR